MLTHAKDMYDALLYAIQKEGTDTIYPNQGIWLLNQAGEQWLKINSKAVDLNQRSIDDCKDAIEHATQVFAVAQDYFNLPPDYFSTVRVMVKLPLGTPCIVDGQWQRVRILRRDLESYIRTDSIARRPSAKKLYYKLTNYTGSVSRLNLYGASMVEIDLEYFKTMTEITQVTSTGPLPKGTDMSHYASYILQEIVDIAERIYGERSQDPRYASILKELQLKAEGE
jgi:hypothetical protein